MCLTALAVGLEARPTSGRCPAQQAAHLYRRPRKQHAPEADASCTASRSAVFSTGQQIVEGRPHDLAAKHSTADLPSRLGAMLTCQEKMGMCPWEHPHYVSQLTSGSPLAKTPRKLIMARPRHDLLLISLPSQRSMPWPACTA